jgi:hypothetical protein
VISNDVHIITAADLNRIKDEAWQKGYLRGVFEAECKARDTARRTMPAEPLPMPPYEFQEPTTGTPLPGSSFTICGNQPEST